MNIYALGIRIESLYIYIRGGGASADLRQDFAQAVMSISVQDRLMKFSGLALGIVLYTLK